MPSASVCECVSESALLCPAPRRPSWSAVSVVCPYTKLSDALWWPFSSSVSADHGSAVLSETAASSAPPSCGFLLKFALGTIPVCLYCLIACTAMAAVTENIRKMITPKPTVALLTLHLLALPNANELHVPSFVVVSARLVVELESVVVLPLAIPLAFQTATAIEAANQRRAKRMSIVAIAQTLLSLHNRDHVGVKT